jgi:hypothetical protein
VRQTLEVQEHAPGVPHRLRDLPRPHVLPDEESGRGIRLELFSRCLQVVFVEEAVDLDSRLLEAGADLGIDVG